ncbi:MAG: glycosyltransferase family 4 protein [Polyangia bacterium]
MLLLLSSLWGATGGIPAFNRLLVRAAASFCAEREERLMVVALTDPQSGPRREPALPAKFEESLAAAALAPGWYRPCGGQRAELVAHALLQARGHAATICGHVNLAPLGLLAPRFGVVAHGTEVWHKLPWSRRLALRRATAVACVSEHTRGAVAQVQGVQPAHLVRVINALDEATAARAQQLRHEPAPAERDSDRPLRVLSVTRLHPAEPKGVDLVIEALAGLPEVHYTVVGEGDAIGPLKERARRLGVADRVRFLGALADAERDLELRRCDVFALPSSGEGFGIAYLEAMAYGKPCLCAQVGGAPEVVLDGVTGLAVVPSVHAVRDGLVRLSEPALRLRLGEAGARRVAEQFSTERFLHFARDFFLRLVL